MASQKFDLTVGSEVQTIYNKEAVDKLLFKPAEWALSSSTSVSYKVPIGVPMTFPISDLTLYVDTNSPQRSTPRLGDLIKGDNYSYLFEIVSVNASEVVAACIFSTYFIKVPAFYKMNGPRFCQILDTSYDTVDSHYHIVKQNYAVFLTTSGVTFNQYREVQTPRPNGPIEGDIIIDAAGSMLIVHSFDNAANKMLGTIMKVSPYTYETGASNISSYNPANSSGFVTQSSARTNVAVGDYVLIHWTDGPQSQIGLVYDITDTGFAYNRAEQDIWIKPGGSEGQVFTKVDGNYNSSSSYAWTTPRGFDIYRYTERIASATESAGSIPSSEYSKITDYQSGTETVPKIKDLVYDIDGNIFEVMAVSSGGLTVVKLFERLQYKVWTMSGELDDTVGNKMTYSGGLTLTDGPTGIGPSRGDLFKDPNGRLGINIAYGVNATPVLLTIYSTSVKHNSSLDGNGSTANPLKVLSAPQLSTAQSLKTKLDSTTAVTFDGSAAQDAIPVVGTLPIANGGTGNTTGLAATATKLATARTIATSGKAVGTATSFDGSANITIPITQVTDAEKWTTARAFSAQNVNLASTSSGSAVSVDGSAAVTLPQSGVTGVLPYDNGGRNIVIGPKSTANDQYWKIVLSATTPSDGDYIDIAAWGLFYKILIPNGLNTAGFCIVQGPNIPIIYRENATTFYVQCIGTARIPYYFRSDGTARTVTMTLVTATAGSAVTVIDGRNTISLPLSVANGGTARTEGSLPSNYETATTAAQVIAIANSMPDHSIKSFIASLASGTFTGTNAPTGWTHFIVRRHDNIDNCEWIASPWSSSDANRLRYFVGNLAANSAWLLTSAGNADVLTTARTIDSSANNATAVTTVPSFNGSANIALNNSINISSVIPAHIDIDANITNKNVSIKNHLNLEWQLLRYLDAPEKTYKWRNVTYDIIQPILDAINGRLQQKDSNFELSFPNGDDKSNVAITQYKDQNNTGDSIIYGSVCIESNFFVNTSQTSADVWGWDIGGSPNNSLWYDINNAVNQMLGQVPFKCPLIEIGGGFLDMLTIPAFEFIHIESPWPPSSSVKSTGSKFLAQWLGSASTQPYFYWGPQTATSPYGFYGPGKIYLPVWWEDWYVGRNN